MEYYSTIWDPFMDYYRTMWDPLMDYYILYMGSVDGLLFGIRAWAREPAVSGQEAKDNGSGGNESGIAER
jgi:hypothetical protein